MYCSQCGKKIGDTMLFCPFCGEPVVIPDQDDDRAPCAAQSTDVSAQEVAPEEADVSAQEAAPGIADALTPEAPAPAGETVEDAEAELLDWSRDRSRRAQDDEWSPRYASEEPFEPLKLEQEAPPPDQEDWKAEIAQKKQAQASGRKAPETRRGEGEPIRLEGSAPRLEKEAEGAKRSGKSRASRRKHANTLVPPKTMNPNDIFMQSRASAFDEDYDEYDEDPDDDFAIDDDEGSFFMRHVRGIVGLALFVILVLMFVIFSFSKAGQYTLAKANLAWSVDAYSQLGYESYQAGRYAQAGLYYEHALQRDAKNYSLASSAAMAYYQAGKADKATEMLKKCVEIDPTLLEPYVYLLKLYPEVAERPWDITQLLQQGYQMTGDTRLNVTG